jgi:hypothetical protein
MQLQRKMKSGHKEIKKSYFIIMYKLQREGVEEKDLSKI